MNILERFISKLDVRGIMHLSILITSSWIVMLACLEWINIYMMGFTLNDHMNALVVHPIKFDYIQNWLTIIWAAHLPLITLKKRPRILSRLTAGILSTHWVLFAATITYSTWYDMSVKVVLWIFAALVILTNFRVEMGDDF